MKMSRYTTQALTAATPKLMSAIAAFTAGESLKEVVVLNGTSGNLVITYGVSTDTVAAGAYKIYTNILPEAYTLTAASTGTVGFMFRRSVRLADTDLTVSRRSQSGTYSGVAATVKTTDFDTVSISEGTTFKNSIFLNTGSTSITVSGTVIASGKYGSIGSIDPTAANIVVGTSPASLRVFFTEAGDDTVHDVESKLEDAASELLKSVDALSAVAVYTGLRQNVCDQNGGILVQATNEEHARLEPERSGDYHMPLAVKLYTLLDADSIGRLAHRKRTAAIRDLFMRAEINTLLSDACEGFAASGLKWIGTRQYLDGRYWVSDIRLEVQCCGVDIPAT